ncbi:homeodomain-interacting protein kinase 4-like [Amblyraja radiata]|uniref:homeodomain-interacting protein kinase 4-like n=1 Tax=Amblyraja radiata TaxID=386614 RepID=UPI001401EAE8|nr:homeodomain-interacting protein kinase 4-like [Amblyraja radiata]
MSAIISHDDIYNIIQLIGEGVYGEVTCCRKKSTGQFVAIKTLKQGGCLASEIRILKLFQNVDTNKFHIVHFLESFHSNGRSYLVFELLEQNLMEFQKANNFAPLRVKHMRIIAIQLLRALVKLKELSIIHTDIKPDNIMLVEHTRFPFRVKVIDFGSASILHEVQHINDPYIQARHYRCPEILLGLPFSEKLDMWSLGCVLAELRLGQPLYPGKNQYDQVQIIVKAQGQPKDYLLNQASKAHLFFKRNACPYSGHQWQLKPLSEYESKMSTTSLEPRRHTVKSLDQLETFNIIQNVFPNDDDIAEFHDRNVMVALLKRMLNFDPKNRISAGTALRHPFITMKQLKKDYNHTKYYLHSVQGLDAALNDGRVENKNHNYQPLKECAKTMHIEEILGPKIILRNLLIIYFPIEAETFRQPEKQNAEAHPQEAAAGQSLSSNATRNNSMSSKISVHPKSIPIKTMIKRENMELTLAPSDVVQNYNSCGEIKHHPQAGMHQYNRRNPISSGQHRTQQGFTEILIAPEGEELNGENDDETLKRGNRRIRSRAEHIRKSGIIHCKQNNPSVLRDHSILQEIEEADLENIHLNLLVKRHNLGSVGEMREEISSSQVQVSETKDTEEEVATDKNSRTTFKQAKFRKRNKKLQKKKKVRSIE